MKDLGGRTPGKLFGGEESGIIEIESLLGAASVLPKPLYSMGWVHFRYFLSAGLSAGLAAGLAMAAMAVLGFQKPGSDLTQASGG